MATVVLTGASAGIGAAAAIELTRQGHEVVATGRSPSKLDAVHRRMRDAAPDGVSVPEAIVADFASLDEVRALADTVLARCPRIDVLANNAGLQTPKRETSVDGYELVFAVNHLAAFLLTDLLLDRLKESGGRVVGTSSAVHRIGKIDFDDLQMERTWSGMRSYGNSKLANILFTSELAKRAGIPASCYHPGGVDTDLGRDSRLSSMAKPVMRWFARTPERGADTLVWLATDAEGAAPTAVYYADRKPAKTSARARDTATAARLWDVSADLVAPVSSAG
jgi:NAD(P)-dependent dehydrogenase (short-subunit alcohol dehydrogenase family)